MNRGERRQKPDTLAHLSRPGFSAEPITVARRRRTPGMLSQSVRPAGSASRRLAIAGLGGITKPRRARGIEGFGGAEGPAGPRRRGRVQGFD